MRVVAILGVIISGVLAVLFFKAANIFSKEEKEGEIHAYPASNYMFGAFLFLIFAIGCLIYALGLWDTLGFNPPEVPVGRQF